MQKSKKTLTTLSVAAALALGGIAVAQTTDGQTGTNAQNPSTASATMGAGAATPGTTNSSDLTSGTMSNSAGTATTTTDSSTTGSSTSLDASAPVAQVDRN